MDARLIVLVLAFAALPAWAFDHGHPAWDALLKKHVVVLQGEHASQVRYDGFAADRAALRAYLDSLSGVPAAEFEGWPKDERKAFLINAYNAFTVEKILTRWPDIRSIWDFGKIFGNPFKDDFFRLLGRPMTLDGIEHETLRRRGAYDDPRVHYAVNCASIGCPMLREEAYVAPRLEAQLDQQAVRFLSDRSRNRFRDGRLEVSKIFDWFKEDFEPRVKYFARYARALDYPGGDVPIGFLDYDWTLNAYRSSSPR
ncbi:MAG: DUF547 domain-containing protein [Betaproteobacteria bacterium]|nr:DUF547 domain-containing protein [Betaproteobacteria bacterium]MDH5220114.1 DUF547 domain-containing protein [Betaproteobacteria bacterium]MDH5350872.1 DUF547 domain-containing protein [Betaproteobacteria bacterium]